MHSSLAPHSRTRSVRLRRLCGCGVLIAVAVVAAVVVARPDVPSSWTSASRTLASSVSTVARHARDRPTGQDGALGGGGGADGLGEADGAVPDGTTVFDDGVPGVARLDPALLGALRRAANDASSSGLGFVVNSGWRSPAYEQRLHREAVAQYGSEAEAARWVARGDTSSHVSGGAVDLGPPEAASWLRTHGAAYGLCPVYGNEPWHYELRPSAVTDGCPALYPDPTYDPRLRP